MMSLTFDWECMCKASWNERGKILINWNITSELEKVYASWETFYVHFSLKKKFRGAPP